LGVALGLYDPKNPRRTYRGEEQWFELLEEFDAFTLRRAFIAAGESPTVAGNLVWFLEEQVSLERHLSRDAAVKYRRVLDDLDPEKVRKLARSIPGWFNSDRAA
jgi:hypothetical protein